MHVWLVISIFYCYIIHDLFLLLYICDVCNFKSFDNKFYGKVVISNDEFLSNGKTMILYELFSKTRIKETRQMTLAVKMTLNGLIFESIASKGAKCCFCSFIKLIKLLTQADYEFLFKFIICCELIALDMWNFSNKPI